MLIVFILFLLPITPAAAYLPSDPLYYQQGYLNYVNISSAWDLAKGDGVVVAVLDSGVDTEHPDLKFNIWKNSKEIANDGLDNDHNGYIDDVSGWDFVDHDNYPLPVAGVKTDKLSVNHGTALAGIIAAVANNGQGMAGIAFNAKIMPLRILESNGEGLVDNLVSAIDYAIKNGADIINLSLVGFEYDSSLEEAVKRANQNGVVVVAAAGNVKVGQTAKDLAIEPAYPACYGDNHQNNTVVAVASLNDQGQKSLFSNYGIGCLDLSAIGEGINSLAYYNPSEGFNSYYSYGWNGTSFSTAIVSGIAALAKSKSLSISANSLINLLRQGTENIDSLNPALAGALGTGKIDAYKVLSSNLYDGGQLIKLKDDSAVYYLDSTGVRHLFSNQNVFWSWYSGAWSDQNIQIIPQEEFDYFKVGVNVTVRPGTKLMRFQNSGRIYAISPGGILHYGSEAVLKKLYGDYQQRVTIMQNSFEADYIRGDDLDGNTYPDGSLIQYANSSDLWYIDKNQKIKLIGQALNLNGFKEEYIIKNVGLTFNYNIGQSLTDLNPYIFIYFLND